MPGADEYTWEKVDAITFRAADIRLYQHVLKEAELQKIHLQSTWPQGGIIRQVESFFNLKEELGLFGFVIVFYWGSGERLQGFFECVRGFFEVL